jgi:diguanylate cyclase (GGDEF)-like protein
MEREHIGFQGLLERVLEPLVRRAAPHKHREVFAALSGGDGDEIQRVALDVIAVLESLGYVKKLSLEENSGHRFTRYLDRTSSTFFLVPSKEEPAKSRGAQGADRSQGGSDAELLNKIQHDTAELLHRITDLEKIFVIDSLTQVYNRAYFEIQLPKEIERARRSKKSVALCFLDIDDYAIFNKKYGIKAGDEVLFAIAKQLKNQVRALDIVSRWGGDEFKILLTAPVTQRDVRAICARLTAPLRDTIATLAGTNHRVTVTKSVGVSMFPDDVERPPRFEESVDLATLKTLGSELSDKANEALLAAKERGKGQVVFYGDLKP